MITEAQRKDRLKGLGGSDMAVILGLSSYKTPYQLFLEKTEQVKDEYEENALQEWGNRLEPVIRIKFAEENQVQVQVPIEDKNQSPPHDLIKCNLNTLVHPFHDFLRANLDGFVPEWNAVLEVKSSMQFMGSQWGESKTDVIPLPYLLQVAHYVSCTNADKAIIAVLIGGNDYREFIYTRDLELEAHLIKAAFDFWDAVKTNTTPSLLNVADANLMYPVSLTESTIVGNEGIYADVSSLREVKEKQAELTELENSYKLKIMEHMGESECLTDENGTRLATWKSNKNSSRRFILKKWEKKDET